MKVIMKNVRHGREDQGRDHIIYADLYDAETGELSISATLEYILGAVKHRGYVLVKE
jgi:hypothetical protein